MLRTLVVASAVLLTAVAARAQEYALSFAGPGRFVRVDGLTLPANLRQLCIELRFKALGPSRKRVALISRWAPHADAQDPGTFELAHLPSGKWMFTVRDTDGRVESVTSASRKRDDAWHHLAARWDGAVLSILIDGVASGTEEIAEFGVLKPSLLPVFIGVPPGTKKRPPFFNGLLGDVGVWSSFRPADGITKRVDPRSPQMRTYFTLRAKVPARQMANAVRSGPPGQLSQQLARSGWCSPRLDLTRHDFDGSVDWNARKFLVRDERRVGVMWQRADDLSIRVAWFDPATDAQETVRLGCGKDEHLVAGAADNDGKLYYLVVQGMPFERSRETPLKATLHKASPIGKPLLRNEIDPRPNAFNVWFYNPSDLGSMRVSNGVVGMIFPHRMYKGSDGLRHQRAIAITFSAKNLAVKNNLGQTSGHSKGNVLAIGAKGRFLGLDLGDNYPRGVHLHRFDARGRLSRVIFTFKTRHGTSPFRGSPRYDAISNGKTKFYKWSNDNGTYTRLGAVVEGRKSYQIVFSTARSLEGKVLDNSRAFPGCKDPWDLVLLRIVKGFQKASGGSVVGDVIIADRKKKSAVETGGFYDFGGRWQSQRITGVNWLTNYGAGEQALAPLASDLPDGGLLILWEKSAGDERVLHALRFDKKGKIVHGPTPIQKHLRLNPEDQLVRIGEHVYFLAGATNDKLRVRLFSYRDGS